MTRPALQGIPAQRYFLRGSLSVELCSGAVTFVRKPEQLTGTTTFLLSLPSSHFPRLFLMKRLLLIALLGFVLSPELVHAQKRRRAQAATTGLTFGAKLGVAATNITNVTQKPGYPDVTFNSRIAPVVGGLANFRFTPQISVQAEVLYAPRNSTRLIPKGIPTESQVDLTYIDLPALIKFNAKIFYLEVGGVASVLASDKLTVAKKVIAKKLVNPLDLGYTLGGGVELESGAIFGARYVRSASSIGLAGPLFAGVDGLENSSLQFTGGYIFNHSSSGGRRRRR